MKNTLIGASGTVLSLAGVWLMAQPVQVERVVTRQTIQLWSENNTPAWQNKVTNKHQYPMGLAFMMLGIGGLAFAGFNTWKDSQQTIGADHQLPEPTSTPLPALQRNEGNPTPAPAPVPVPVPQFSRTPVSLSRREPETFSHPEASADGEDWFTLGPLEELIHGGEHPKHYGLVTSTRCGKTLTTRAVIYSLLQSDPNIEIDIIDPKNSQWMGLEDVGRVHYCFDEQGRQSPEVARRVIGSFVGEFRRRMVERDKASPRRFLFIDEWTSLKNELSPDDIKALEHCLTMGLEFGCQLFIVTHSHQCNQFGFDKALRNNFAFISIGKWDDAKYLKMIASDAHLFPFQEDRNTLTERINRAVADARDNNPSIPIYLVSTTMQVGQLPNWLPLESFKFPIQEESVPEQAPHEGLAEHSLGVTEGSVIQPLRVTMQLPSNQRLSWLLSYAQRKREEGKTRLTVSQILAANSPNFRSAESVREALTTLAMDDYVSYSPEGAGEFSLLGEVDTEHLKFRAFTSA